MLPIEIAQRLKFPGQIEKAFLQYLKRAKLSIDQSKTIASQNLYHRKSITGLNTVQFFTGQYDQNETNVPTGSFLRPASEHFVIYGIKLSAVFTNLPITNVAQQVFTGGITDSFTLVSSEVQKLVQSQMNLVVNGIQVLKNMPLSESVANITTENQGVILLNEPVIWAGQTEIDLSIAAKNGVQWGDAGSNFYMGLGVELIGIGLI